MKTTATKNIIRANAVAKLILNYKYIEAPNNKK